MKKVNQLSRGQRVEWRSLQGLNCEVFPAGGWLHFEAMTWKCLPRRPSEYSGMPPPPPLSALSEWEIAWMEEEKLNQEQENRDSWREFHLAKTTEEDDVATEWQPRVFRR